MFMSEIKAVVYLKLIFSKIRKILKEEMDFIIKNLIHLHMIIFIILFSDGMFFES